MTLAAVSVRPEQQPVPLSDLLRYGRLTAAEAALVAEGVLMELAALHAGGRAHGSVQARTVGVTSDGFVHLGAAGRGRSHDARGDLVACGRLPCQTLGVDAPPRPGLEPAEPAGPAAGAAAPRHVA